MPSDLQQFIFMFLLFFFFNDTATSDIYTLSLHDALPISTSHGLDRAVRARDSSPSCAVRATSRSEEHTSELQSPDHLVCRLLLEKKKKTPSSTRRTRFAARLSVCLYSCYLQQYVYRAARH